MTMAKKKKIIRTMISRATHCCAPASPLSFLLLEFAHQSSSGRTALWFLRCNINNASEGYVSRPCMWEEMVELGNDDYDLRSVGKTILFLIFQDILTTWGHIAMFIRARMRSDDDSGGGVRSRFRIITGVGFALPRWRALCLGGNCLERLH